MKSYICIFSFAVGMNIFAAQRQQQQWNEDIIRYNQKFHFNRLAAHGWKKTNTVLGIHPLRKPAHYPKDRTPKKDKLKGI